MSYLILYKLLDKGMISPYQNFKFELGKKYHCDNFDMDKNEGCSFGFYATDLDGLFYAYRPGKKFYQAEVWGKRIEINQFKRRYENIRIIKEISKEEIKKLANAQEKKLGYKLSEILFPFNPLIGKPKKVTQEIIDLMNDFITISASVWTSVCASVWDPVWDSVRASVCASVWDPVRASVRASVSVCASVGDPVKDSIGSYMSSFFPNIKKWKYIKHKEGKNPFQSGIDLWKKGFVYSYDGKTHRLHSGKGAKIVYELKGK